MADAVTYTARWVFPVSHPPLDRGTITVEGTTITAVDPHGTRTPDVDLGNVAVIPGLVNCHTHLDLSGARGKIPPTDPDHFTDWLRGVIAYRNSRSLEQVQAEIRDGLVECLRFGTTLIGDIAIGSPSWNAIISAELRGVVFRELITLGSADQDAYFNASAWVNSHPDTPICRVGVSPHAPYTVKNYYFELAGKLCERGGRHPLAVHLGESPAEVEMLYERRGPLVEFLKSKNLYQPETVVTNFDEVIRLCDVRQPKLLIHMNYVPIHTNLTADTTIVYCPRTHAAFGHPRHPFREFQQRGVRVALGTDSLASNPDLDLLAEARFVHSIRPDVPCDELLRMATLTGAEALGWADEAGSLEADKSADFVVLPLANREVADPHDLIFGKDFPTAERRTMFRGQWRN